MAITHWHQLLGKLLEELLPAVRITVQTEFNIMSNPPRIDVVLLRRQAAAWTPAQRARLPDGVRDSTANHILLEFKYTESVTRRVIHKAIGYAAFYRDTQELPTPHSTAQIFILSSKTPRRAFLQTYGYQVRALPGVYYSDNCILQDIPLLALNQLRDVPHNAYMKCFASRQREKAAAFALLGDRDKVKLSPRLGEFLMGLRTYWFTGGTKMDTVDVITPESIMALGQKMGQAYLASLTVEDVLARFKPEERLRGLKPEERLAGLEPYLAELAQAQQRQSEYHALDRTLRLRFQAALETYQQRLAPLDLASLNELNELLITVDSLPAFEAALENMLLDR